MRHPYLYLGTPLIALCVSAGFLLPIHSIVMPSQDMLATNEESLPFSLEYHLLAADIAWQRELWEEAAHHYLILAHTLQSVDFAVLASSAALEAQALPKAQEAVTLWAYLAPNDLEAHALNAMLSLHVLDETKAQDALHQLMTQSASEALPHLMAMTKVLQHPSEEALFLSLLEKMAVLYSHEASIWFALARQAQHMYYYDLALDATDQALALAPTWVSAIALKVQILYQTEQKTAARDYLAHILEKHPEESDLHFIYGQIENEIH